jgi:hypothetical protein
MSRNFGFEDDCQEPCDGYWNRAWQFRELLARSSRNAAHRVISEHIDDGERQFAPFANLLQIDRFLFGSRPKLA